MPHTQKNARKKTKTDYTKNIRSRVENGNVYGNSLLGAGVQADRLCIAPSLRGSSSL